MTAIELSFTEAGTGVPLVILHGLFGSKRNWGMIIRLLGPEFRTISADLRNHGDSPWSDRMTYPDMAEDVADLIERTVGGPAHVLGHSMGGKTAMVLALTRPDLIDRLIVADIPPAPRDSGLIAYIRAMRALDVSGMTRRAEAEEALAPVIPEKGIRTFLAQNLAPADGGGLSWKLNLPVLEGQMDEIEGFPDIDSDDAFPRPSLFLVGANSNYVLPQHHGEIDRLFPQSDIVSIPDAAHWLHAEQPARVTEEIQNFLR
ncbi:MAG: alpha/beta fold hydrolase [Alphaproteobacteria bacterium]